MKMTAKVTKMELLHTDGDIRVTFEFPPGMSDDSDKVATRHVAIDVPAQQAVKVRIGDTFPILIEGLHEDF